MNAQRCLYRQIAAVLILLAGLALVEMAEPHPGARDAA